MSLQHRLGLRAVVIGLLLFGAAAYVPILRGATWVVLPANAFVATGVMLLWIARARHRKQRHARMTIGVLLMTLGLIVAVAAQVVATRTIGPNIGLGLIVFGGLLLVLIGVMIASSTPPRDPTAQLD